MNPWTLAWARFYRDRVGLVSFLVVLLYLALMAGSGTGLVARGWEKEVGVSYAPPVFMGKGISQKISEEEKREEAANDFGIPDPLAEDLAEVRKALSGASATEAKAVTLPLGADKWGRDVVQKTIKGSETSLFVGFAAALLAVFLGTVLGALAGYYGAWIDDLLNWVYNVFTSIPYLLLILAVAAVLGQKGSV